jgi:hypothetical protein
MLSQTEQKPKLKLKFLTSFGHHIRPVISDIRDKNKVQGPGKLYS